MDVVTANISKFDEAWRHVRHQALFDAFIEIMDRCDEGIQNQGNSSFADRVKSWELNGFKSIRIYFDEAHREFRVFSYVDGEFLYESPDEYTKRVTVVQLNSLPRFASAATRKAFIDGGERKALFCSLTTFDGAPQISIKGVNLVTDERFSKTLLGPEAINFYEKYLTITEEK